MKSQYDLDLWIPKLIGLFLSEKTKLQGEYEIHGAKIWHKFTPTHTRTDPLQCPLSQFIASGYKIFMPESKLFKYTKLNNQWMSNFQIDLFHEIMSALYVNKQRRLYYFIQ